MVLKLLGSYTRCKKYPGGYPPSVGGARGNGGAGLLEVTEGEGGVSQDGESTGCRIATAQIQSGARMVMWGRGMVWEWRRGRGAARYCEARQKQVQRIGRDETRYLEREWGHVTQHT